MKTNGLQNLTLTIFYLLLLVVPVYWIVRGPVDTQKSLAEGRFLKVFPAISFREGALVTNINDQKEDSGQSDLLYIQISGKSFQRIIEQSASDQFPLRFSGILTAKAVDRVSISIAYSFLPDKAIPADMQSRLYVMRDGSKLLPEPNTFSKNVKKQINTKAEGLNTLIELYPDIHFYLFYHQKLAHSPFHPLTGYFRMLIKVRPGVTLRVLHQKNCLSAL